MSVKKFSVEDRIIPPASMRNHAEDDAYINSAVHNIATIDRLSPIQTHSRVLDVGCAAGRLALPLLNYLDPEVGGYYEGFDIQKERIDWADTNIAAQYKNFKFHFYDVKNSYMNSSGDICGSSFTFPYEENSFDLIIFHSVFTHLTEEDALNYLIESKRVLSRGKSVIYATFFLWDDETAQSVQQNQVRWSFPIDLGNYRVVDLARPELAVAFNYGFLKRELKKAGLEIKSELRGSWRSSVSSGQDILILGHID